MAHRQHTHLLWPVSWEADVPMGTPKALEPTVPAPGLWTPPPSSPGQRETPILHFPPSQYEPQSLPAQEAPLPKVMLTKPLLRARREPAGQSYHRSSQVRSGHRAGRDSRIYPCEGSVLSLSVYAHVSIGHLCMTSMLPFTLPPAVILRRARRLVRIASSVPASPHCPNVPRAPETLTPGPGQGQHLPGCGRTGSKCLFAGFPRSRSAVSVSVSPSAEEADGWFFGSLSVSVCLPRSPSVSLPTVRHREGRCPRTLHPPALAPAWPPGLQLKQRQRVQLLDYRAFASSSLSRSTRTRREEGGHRPGGPGHAEHRTATRNRSPNTQLGAGAGGRADGREQGAAVGSCLRAG